MTSPVTSTSSLLTALSTATTAEGVSAAFAQAQNAGEAYGALAVAAANLHDFPGDRDAAVAAASQFVNALPPDAMAHLCARAAQGPSSLFASLENLKAGLPSQNVLGIQTILARYPILQTTTDKRTLYRVHVDKKILSEMITGVSGELLVRLAIRLLNENREKIANLLLKYDRELSLHDETVRLYIRMTKEEDGMLRRIAKQSELIFGRDCSRELAFLFLRDTARDTVLAQPANTEVVATEISHTPARP